MKINRLRLTFDKGLNADALPSELGEGFCSDCNGFRFRKGFAEIVGGTSSTSVAFTGTSSGVLFNLYRSSASYVVCSSNTATGVYEVGGSTTPTAITRKLEGAAISNATAAGTTVTVVTSTNHGMATNDVISVWGFTPSTYNAESVAITRIDAVTFTYVVASAPATSPATAFGMYSEDDTASHVRFSTGGELNGILILNSTTAGCYYWNGDTTIPARKIVGSYTSTVGIPYKNFIVQLNPLIDGTRYPYRICWSDAVEAGSVPHNDFTAATTNQAGDVDKPEIGVLVYAEPLGDDLIVYGTNGRLVMRYVGGNDVFSFTVLPGNEGLYGTSTVANTPMGHVFVDRDRHVRVHSGGATRDISEGRVQSLLGHDDASVAWVVAHKRQNEVWIGYVISSEAPAGYTTEFALIWNWEEDTWGHASVTNKDSAISVRTSSLTTNQKLYAVSGDAATLALDELDADQTATSSAYIERQGMDGGDSDVVKNLQRSRWKIDNVSGYTPVYTVSHGSSMYVSTSPTYATGVTYTPGTTDYCNARATGGKYMAVKLTIATSTTSGSLPYYRNRIRTTELEFTIGGRR